MCHGKEGGEVLAGIKAAAIILLLLLVSLSLSSVVVFMVMFLSLSHLLELQDGRSGDGDAEAEAAITVSTGPVIRGLGWWMEGRERKGKQMRQERMQGWDALISSQRRGCPPPLSLVSHLHLGYVEEGAIFVEHARHLLSPLSPTTPRSHVLLPTQPARPHPSDGSR